MQFSVRVPDKHDLQHVREVVVEARDSLSALRLGLEELGDSIDMSAMVCDFSDPARLRVTDPGSGRIILIEDFDPNAAPPSNDADKPAPANTDEQPPLAATEDLPALRELAETKELPSAPVTTEPSVEGVEAEGPADSSADSDASTGGRDLGKTELYIPTFDVEEAMAAARAKQEQEKARAAVEMPAVVSESVEMDAGEATALDSSALPASPSASADSSEPSSASAHTLDPVASVPASASSSGPAPRLSNTLSILTGAEGQYKPGMTTETLANVFMRAMDIYDYSDRSEAMKFVLELALTDVSALGGGVLLTDINSPDQVLWFEHVAGPQAELIQNFRVPLGQGLIGYCAQQGVSQNIADVAYEPRYQDEVLRNANLSIGSLICVPIQHQERVYGAIVFYHATGERPYTQGEVSVLSYLAHVAGEYLAQQ